MGRSVACLPGDGIGPEVMAQAVRVLAALGFETAEHPFGGAAIDATGDPLPPETLAAAREADAVLLGAVGGPSWTGGPGRPQQGLIDPPPELRTHAHPRPAVGPRADPLIVRELRGGPYYPAPRTRA